jgi:hypothetical protein
MCLLLHWVSGGTGQLSEWEPRTCSVLVGSAGLVLLRVGARKAGDEEAHHSRYRAIHLLLCWGVIRKEQSCPVPAPTPSGSVSPPLSGESVQIGSGSLLLHQL